MSSQSPIFTKTEVFMVWLLNHTAKFPKLERFRLAKRMEDALFDFHAALIAATHSTDPFVSLQYADIELAKLRSYFRISLECRYTAPNQYEYAARNLTEIGKLLGGWIKKVES